MDRKYNIRVRTDVKNREGKSEVEESVSAMAAAATARVAVHRFDIKYVGNKNWKGNITIVSEQM